MASNVLTLLYTTVTDTGETHTINKRYVDTIKAFHITLEGTGAVTATVILEVSNNATDWLSDTESTVAVSGTTLASEGRVLVGNWVYVRARCTAISGTGATLTVRMGA